MEDCSRISTQHYKAHRKTCLRSQGNLGWPTSWKEVCRRAATSCASTSSYSKRPMMKPPTRLSVISNVAGEEVKRLRRFSARCKMATGTVRWLDCMERLAECGCEFFMKLRPGNVLGGLLTRVRVRRCSPWATGNQCAYASGRSVPGTSACC